MKTYMLAIVCSLLIGSGCDSHRLPVSLDVATNPGGDGGLLTEVSVLGDGQLPAAEGPSTASGWAISPGKSGAMTGTALALDPLGNIYVTGYFRGNATFAGVKHTSRGSYDVVLLKLSPAGKELWARSMGGPGDDRGTSVAVDSKGEAYVTGFFAKKASFGSTTLSTKKNSQVFLARISALGKTLWAWTSSPDFGGRGFDVAVGPGGTVVVAGLNGFGTLLAAGFNPQGKLSWHLDSGSGTACVGLGVAVHPTGNTYLVGTFFGPNPLKLGSSTLSTTLSTDDFVARLSPQGKVTWVTSLPPKNQGSEHYQQATRVATVPGGGCIVAGGHGKKGKSWTTGYLSPEVARLTTAGKVDWVVRPNSYDAPLSGLAVAHSGEAYITGYTGGSLAFAGGSYSPVGQHDLFVARLSSKGVLDWATGVADTGQGPGTDVAVAGKQLLVLGSFGGKAVTVGGAMLASRDHDNMLLWRLPRP